MDSEQAQAMGIVHYLKIILVDITNRDARARPCYTVGNYKIETATRLLSNCNRNSVYYLMALNTSCTKRLMICDTETLCIAGVYSG
jgi:hypothetical protein